MKKILLLAVAVLAASLPSWSATIDKALIKKIAKIQKAQRTESSELWLPTTFNQYAYEDGAWALDYKDTYTYNTQGYVTSSLNGNGVKIDYILNDNNRPTSSITSVVDDAGNVTPYYKFAINYDDVVTDFVTEYKTYSYSDGQWVLYTDEEDVEEYNWKKTITRDANGNITSIVCSNYNGSTYVDKSRYTMTVGTDGKIATWKVEKFDSKTNVWTTKYNMTNIVWNTTDGQLVNTNPNDYKEGSNRIASANLYENLADGARNSTLTATYGDHGSYCLVKDYVDGTLNYREITKRDNTDDFGSGECVTTTYSDSNNDGTFSESEAINTETETCKYDTNGNVTLYKYITDGTIYTWYTYDIKYDFAKSTHPTEVVGYNYDKSTKAMVPSTKEAYSDFVDVSNSTGITTVAADAASTATATEVYTISGQRVGSSLESLPAGLYIVRTGATATKVLKR